MIRPPRSCCTPFRQSLAATPEEARCSGAWIRSRAQKSSTQQLRKPVVNSLGRFAVHHPRTFASDETKYRLSTRPQRDAIPGSTLGRLAARFAKAGQRTMKIQNKIGPTAGIGSSLCCSSIRTLFSRSRRRPAAQGAPGVTSTTTRIHDLT
jgi:hypothetical protein